ncbi:alanine--tRNA ligase [Patescibacteria group bacterium]|nr:alanine--tRNA ligase [Patescibacteria group bacterium]MBU1256181.1 alanine--tRNA ligase [Patescibacteria group bacterium]MBU1457672.1 alanine--tRNA ligase [Patescibacteria group bacterium]
MTMTADQLRQKYLDFFVSKGHKIIPPAPLIPENDPTTLFTSSGMQPLIPYLKGKPHPMGNRLVNSQPCFRAEDIEEVGNNRHTTFFDMLGNWSLGDYFKTEQLTWIWEFFTRELNLPREKLHVTLFEGNKDVPKDGESFKIWQDIGVPKDHIHFYDATKNWWSRSGTPENMPPGEIGGPDSEIFFEFTQIKHNSKFGKKCHVNCDCGRFVEIGNSVFMQYEKQEDGTFKPLPKQNVDFGGGLERLTQAVQNSPDMFQIDIFKPLIQLIEQVTGQKYQGENRAPMRIMADHLRAAKAMIEGDLVPSNKQQGYVLRRLIRRSAVKFRQLTGKLDPNSFSGLVDEPVIVEEINKFQKSLTKGLNLIEKTDAKKINAQFAFDLFQTHGFPFEITQEILSEKGLKLDEKAFVKIKEKHQQKSRTASAGMFKGGLSDHSETTTKYHTATHLLHQAMRDVLGNHVQQSGSNITVERLRFDFAHNKALTEKEILKIEKIIKQKIEEDLLVTQKEMPYQEAIDSGVLAFFKQKYPDQVTVYSIGEYSKELCGGPHVTSTGKIGKIKIDKQKALGQGLRRLYLK